MKHLLLNIDRTLIHTTHTFDSITHSRQWLTVNSVKFNVIVIDERSTKHEAEKNVKQKVETTWQSIGLIFFLSRFNFCLHFVFVLFLFSFSWPATFCCDLSWTENHYLISRYHVSWTILKWNDGDGHRTMIIIIHFICIRIRDIFVSKQLRDINIDCWMTLDSSSILRWK